MTGIMVKKRSEIHLARRFWHALAGIMLLIPYFVWDAKLLYLGIFSFAFSLVGFFFDFKRQANERLNKRFQSFFMPIMRRSEIDSFSGIPFYALGVALSCFLYNEHIAVISILFLIFADPIASIVGVYLSKGRIFPNKTLEGTIACFVVCFFVVIFYCRVFDFTEGAFIPFALLAAIAGAVAELLSAFNIDDNFTIPVVAGGLMTILNSCFLIF